MALRRETSAMLLLAIVGMAAVVQPAQAFCVYNTGKTKSATFMAWPVSGQTFKKVVAPGKSECCNWSNPTCFAKEAGEDGDDPLDQCADVAFYIADRVLDTDGITKNLVKKEVEEILSPFIAIFGVALSLVPGFGAVAGLAAGFTAAGLDLGAISTKTGIDFQPGDKLVHACNGGAVQFNADTNENPFSNKAPNC